MEYCIYHNKDLDGLTSAAVLYANQKRFGEELILVGYDYGEKLDTRKFKGKITVMIDVSMEMDRMETLGKGCLELIWIDHHISAKQKLFEYCEEKGYEVKENKMSSFVTQYDIKQMNMVYYYSDTFSACEIASNLYAPNIKEKGRQIINTLGQYDTWRKTEEKQLPRDKNWETEVLPIQWAMRTYGNPFDIYKLLIAIDDWQSSHTIDTLLSLGKSILSYQKLQYETIMKKCSFEFEMNGLKVLAVNAFGFGSVAFDGFYFEEVHDIMVAFYYNGSAQKWTVSLYTTKDEIDLLYIAKNFGGGGHAKACGFSVAGEELRMEKGVIQIGPPAPIMFDLESLPKDFNPEEFKKMLMAPGMIMNSPTTEEQAQINHMPIEGAQVLKIVQDEVEEEETLSPEEAKELLQKHPEQDELTESMNKDMAKPNAVFEVDDNDDPFNPTPKLFDTATGNEGYKYNVMFLHKLKDAKKEGRLIKLNNGNWDVVNATEAEKQILEEYGKI